MNTRVLLNLGLLALVLVLVAVVVLSPEENAVEMEKLTQLQIDAVERLEITRQGQGELSFEKVDGNWYMQSPYQIQANRFRIEALLGLVTTPSHTHYNLKGKDLASYGLEPPGASVNINDAITIEFGSSEPLHQRRYVRIGDTLHLIEDLYYFQLGMTPVGFVSNALLAPDATPTVIRLPALTLRKQGDSWILDPAQDDVSSDRIYQLVQEWRNAQAIRVEPYTEGQTEGEIIIETAEGTPVHFAIRHADDGIILARADKQLQYLLSGEIARRLMELPPPVEDTPADEPETPPETDAGAMPAVPPPTAEPATAQ